MPCSTCRPPCAPARHPHWRWASNLGLIDAGASDGQWLFTNYRVLSPASHVLDGFLAFAKELDKDLTPDWQLLIRR